VKKSNYSPELISSIKKINKANQAAWSSMKDFSFDIKSKDKAFTFNRVSADLTYNYTNKFISKTIFEKDKKAIITIKCYEHLDVLKFKIEVGYKEYFRLNYEEFLALIEKGGYENDETDRYFYFLK
jgi:hypothetical protein